MELYNKLHNIITSTFEYNSQKNIEQQGTDFSKHQIGGIKTSIRFIEIKYKSIQQKWFFIHYSTEQHPSLKQGP